MYEARLVVALVCWDSTSVERRTEQDVCAPYTASRSTKTISRVLLNWVIRRGCTATMCGDTRRKSFADTGVDMS